MRMSLRLFSMSHLDRNSSALKDSGTSIINCVLQKFALTGEPKLNVFSYRMMRRTFRHKRDEVTGEGRKLHKEHIHEFYVHTNNTGVFKSKRNRWEQHLSISDGKRCMQNLVGRSTGKRKFERPKRRWEDNIKNIFKKWLGGCGFN